MGRSAVALVSILILMTAGTGCRQQLPVAYPATWPDGKVTVPNSSTQAVFLDDVEKRKIHGYENRTCIVEAGRRTAWCVGFTNQLSWEENVKHLEGCLANKGFRKRMTEDNSYSKAMHYYAGDLTMRIRLVNLKTENVYQLQLIKYDPPMDKLPDGFIPLD